jgi:hypothetical protein
MIGTRMDSSDGGGSRGRSQVPAHSSLKPLLQHCASAERQC